VSLEGEKDLETEADTHRGKTAMEGRGIDYNDAAKSHEIPRIASNHRRLQSKGKILP